MIHKNNEQFPIHYEDDNVVVFTNPSNEVFVKSKRIEACSLRITPHKMGLDLSAFNGLPFVIRQISM